METLLNQLEHAEKDALQWLIHAYQRGQGGFPHSRWMFLPAAIAWNKDYAETTGYLIENFLDYNVFEDPILSQIALSAGDWLLRIQSSEGFFHKGTQFNTPSAFNTSQVLFGFERLYTFTKEEEYFEAMSKAFHWLIAGIDEHGFMKRGLYVNGYYAAYYARAIWPLIMINQKHFNSRFDVQLTKSLEYLYSYKNEYGLFRNAGFYPDKPSLLHTLAYTLEGFYESSKLMKMDAMKSHVLQILDRICELVQKHSNTPAYVYPDFKTDFSFICVCGQAQICALLLKAYLDHGEKRYRETATFLFSQILTWQIKSKSREHHGALPSSLPVWDNYFSFRYTNWTMKFFLDSCWLMKKVISN